MSAIDTLPPSTATKLDAPVRKVTLLEDRAQIVRTGTLTLAPGQHKLVTLDVTPVLQDLSLRAQASGTAQVVDARVRRAMRVNRDEKPERAKTLENEIEALTRKYEQLGEDRALCEQRRNRLEAMLERGFNEWPEDVSWGLTQPQWKESIDGLFVKVRELRTKELELQQAMNEVAEERAGLVVQRQAFDRPDTRFVAWLEADLVVTSAGPVEVTFEYTVANALWRPLHSARLNDAGFHFESRASVWQNTGEDWNNVRLVFSTARASLGIEPPLLNDDVISAQKKNEKVVLQAREVTIAKAKADSGSTGGGGAKPSPKSVELPGVDDGGEIRNLEAPHPCTVPSDGRPNVVSLFSFDATPKTKLVAFPELELRAFLKSVQKNEGRFPILAGPVELLLQNGFVGWTEVLFVAPGEEFALSFGPDEAVRIARTDRAREQDSTVDKWKTTTTTVWVYVSNLGDLAKRLEVTERMPTSEVEQVKIELGVKRTSPKPKVDENGFATWVLELEPHGQTQVTFAYDVATAPGVQGL